MKKKEVIKLPFDPSKEVRSDYWTKLSVEQLWNQHILMHQRLLYAQRLENHNLKQGLVRGLATLKELIDAKYKTEERDPRSPLIY